MTAASLLTPWTTSPEFPRTLWAAVAAVALAAAIVLVLVPLLRRFAWWTGYLDHPEARKLHTHATPLLGGLGVATGTLVAAWVLIRYLDVPVPREAWWWGGGALAALVLGLVDDRFGMHPLPKL